jgi:hypothetical protein
MTKFMLFQYDDIDVETFVIILYFYYSDEFSARYAVFWTKFSAISNKFEYKIRYIGTSTQFHCSLHWMVELLVTLSKTSRRETWEVSIIIRFITQCQGIPPHDFYMIS